MMVLRFTQRFSERWGACREWERWECQSAGHLPISRLSTNTKTWQILQGETSWGQYSQLWYLQADGLWKIHSFYFPSVDHFSTALCLKISWGREEEKFHSFSSDCRCHCELSVWATCWQCEVCPPWQGRGGHAGQHHPQAGRHHRQAGQEPREDREGDRNIPGHPQHQDCPGLND